MAKAAIEMVALSRVIVSGWGLDLITLEKTNSKDGFIFTYKTR